jgi:hypothetical protein
MGNFNFTVPSLGTEFIDYREQILGDSFNWSWVHPLSEYRYLAIHHSAGPDNQTPDDIASYHVNSLGWGGIGYHFVITKDGTTYYVGDLTTARANVANMNNLVVGICLVGSFIDGKEPTDAQINSAHELCSQLLFRTPELSGVNDWINVVGHQDLMATRCPGDAWASWKSKIITSATPPAPDTRRQDITLLYQVVLGRDPDQAGLDQYAQSASSVEEIRKIMTESTEHRQLINDARNFRGAKDLAAQEKSLLTTAQAKVDEIIQLGQ